jgi:hypothetical protein
MRGRRGLDPGLSVDDMAVVRTFDPFTRQRPFGRDPSSALSPNSLTRPDCARCLGVRYFLFLRATYCVRTRRSEGRVANFSR